MLYCMDFIADFGRKNLDAGVEMYNSCHILKLLKSFFTTNINYFSPVKLFIASIF